MDDIGTIGHNEPPQSVVGMQQRIDELSTQAELWLKRSTVTTQEDADRAGNWAGELSKLKREADTLRKDLKAPHLAAGKKIDGDFRPMIKRADGVVSALKSAMTAFMRAEKERIARERREAEEKARAEAEAAQQAAYDEGNYHVEIAEPEPIAEAEPVRAGGAVGRSIGLRNITRAEITDYDKLVHALKDHREMKDLVEKLANRAAKKGYELDGMKIIQEEIAA